MTFNPATLDIATLPSLPFSERKELPSVSCVYVVESGDGQSLYVGQTGNLNRRLNTGHHARGHFVATEGTKVRWLIVEHSQERLSIEGKLIDLLKPSLNRARPLIGESLLSEDFRLMIKIARCFKKPQMKQLELARELGISPSRMCNIENGWEPATQREIELIKQILADELVAARNLKDELEAA